MNQLQEINISQTAELSFSSPNLEFLDLSPEQKISKRQIHSNDVLQEKLNPKLRTTEELIAETKRMSPSVEERYVFESQHDLDPSIPAPEPPLDYSNGNGEDLHQEKHFMWVPSMQ